MTNYHDDILHRLIDKYEKSKSFAGTNTVNQSFSLVLSKAYPEYADDSCVAEIRSVETAAEQLAAEGLAELKYRKNGLLEAVTLRTDRLEDAYRALRRKPKKDLQEELRALYEQYAGENQILTAFCRAQLDRLQANKNPEYFRGNLKEFKLILTALKALTHVDLETFERDFSVRVFGDSKQFGKIRSTVVAILYAYGDFPRKETVLEDLNILRNPGHVFLKGNAVLTFNAPDGDQSSQTLDLSALSGDIAISSIMLKDIARIKVPGKRVVTIENLTAFNAYAPGDELVLYLGGFLNTARQDFIRRLYADEPDAEYYHAGDIDAGGFHILLNLRKKTGVPFRALNMDAETLRENREFTKRLTENDVRRLRKLLGGEFDETVKYMLENDCKLEQEALD